MKYLVWRREHEKYDDEPAADTVDADSHEEAAKQRAEEICNDDCDYYTSFDEGVDFVVEDPAGVRRIICVAGYSDYVFYISKSKS